jgi:hypothetical protein
MMNMHKLWIYEYNRYEKLTKDGEFNKYRSKTKMNRYRIVAKERKGEERRGEERRGEERRGEERRGEERRGEDAESLKVKK